MNRIGLCTHGRKAIWNGGTCKICLEGKPEKRFKAELRAKLYNSEAEKILPYVKKYQRALKKIWQQKKCLNDYQILEDFGLGKAEVNWWTKKRFEWNWEIKNLNDRIMRQRIE